MIKWGAEGKCDYFLHLVLSESRKCYKMLRKICKRLIHRINNPVFDSLKKKKSLYPLPLLGYSDFMRCHGLWYFLASLAIFLNILHFAFGYELIIGSEAAYVMEIICDFISFV